jgi:hypothetical protein
VKRKRETFKNSKRKRKFRFASRRFTLKAKIASEFTSLALRFILLISSVFQKHMQPGNVCNQESYVTRTKFEKKVQKSKREKHDSIRVLVDPPASQKKFFKRIFFCRLRGLRSFFFPDNAKNDKILDFLKICHFLTFF